MDEMYTVTIRVQPHNINFEMDLAPQTTGKAIKDALLGDPNVGIPRTTPNGEAYSYNLASKGSGKRISDDDTLYTCGVQDGDTLLMTADLIAG
jgi:hypothetical protein